jgi:hypothetical protein
MFKVEIKGVDRLQKELKELGDAARALDGELCNLQFDPGNEESVRDAIARMESAVDAKLATWRGNPGVRAIAEKSTEHFRQRILERVTEAKTTGS